MATYTEHYGLHQWEPEDDFLRTDFNTDFGKIDAALGGKAEQSQVDTISALTNSKCRVVVGYYVGKGEYQEIDIGAPVMAVIVLDDFYTVCSTKMSGTNNMITVNGNGFYVLGSSTVDVNKKGVTYHYIVLI